jgi:hypothetical protein
MLRMVATDNRRASTRPSEIAAQERDAGAFDRYIRAAAHRDADVGRGQRRRVIDAIADHGDAAAFGAQPLHHLALLLGQYAASISSIPSWEASARGRRIVAGEHHDAQAFTAQRRKCEFEAEWVTSPSPACRER